MEVAVLLANPAASQFTGGLHRAVTRGLATAYRVDALWPNSPDEAQVAAAKAAADGAELVVAMGGDGVVHHVAQGLVGSETSLGILPVGTTNVLARLLGIPHRAGAALKLLTGDHRVSTQPVLEIVADTPIGSLERSAVFALGVGADARVVQEAETEPFRKYRFGGVHYARTTLRVAWSDLRHRQPEGEVLVGGEAIPAFGVMAQFHRAYTYFGRIPLRLAADPPDPMTVLAIDDLAMRRAPRIAAGIAGGRGLGGVRGFTVYEQVDSLGFRADEPVPVQADGEHLGSVTRLEARLRPDSLPVVVPPSDDG